jgi:methylenetetrahydrofolate reductase (NADPH)
MSHANDTKAPSSLSFEFFPPKDEAGIDRLINGTASRLSAFRPDYFSVTFGAGGSTREGTQALVEKLIRSGANAVPHLSVGGSTDEEIDRLVERYQHLGIQRILCLRGDQPSDGNHRTVFAKDLVEQLHQRFPGQFELSVAAYPEIHPDSASAEEDMRYFAAKVHAGASSAITQYFYSPDAYEYFMERCEKAGVHIPVHVGVMPITNIDSLQRFSAKAGADIPRWLSKSMAGYADDEKGLVSFGVEVVTNLCEKLLTMGAPGLHFYTLNRWGASSQICRNLGFPEH